MPTCSSSVARARQSLREGAMTTRALDANAILNVAGRVVRQPTHEGTATRPEALAVLLARQRAAFLRDGPPSLAERRANLKKLRAAVLARRADLEAALDADFGHRSRHETAIMEMLALTWGIDYLHKNLRRFMRRERRRVALPMRFARAHVEYQPLGVVGIVAPWNYPLSLALMPLATALAAGNRAMIKPSELTPATSDAPGGVDRRDLLRGRGRRRHRRRLRRRRLRGPAVRSPLLHREHSGRPRGDARRQRASRAGDARARRQVAGARRSRAAARARRGRHRLRQAGQCRPDLRRAGLRAAARGATSTGSSRRGTRPWRRSTRRGRRARTTPRS